MGEVKHTPGRRLYEACYAPFAYRGSWAGGSSAQHGNYERAAREFLNSDPLTRAAPELLAALKQAQAIIDATREELHQRRVADWHPEGAHNAAAQMSEDMRLIGNLLADADFSAAIAKAEGR